MKLALIVAASLLPLHLFAQDSTQKKNELGLFAESNSMDSYNGGPSMGTIGLTYKHHKNDFLSLVLLAGQTNYGLSPIGISIPPNFKDTLTWRDINTTASLATIGVGVEVQRKFYKRISLFAGGELRASYGTGRIDTTDVSIYKVPQTAPYPGGPTYTIDATVNNTSGANISMMHTGIIPYIGIKVNLGRLNLGYMMSNYMFRFHSESTDTHSYSLFNFELGNTYQRLFATYRF